MNLRHNARQVAAALLAAAAVAGAHGQAAQGADALPPLAGARPWVLPQPRLAEPAQVTALLERAEAALAAGDPLGAQAAFEQAAALRHTAEIEIGWVHAQMQAGEYRCALAFAAHTADAHKDSGAGVAMYGWLLHLGGQPALARTLLTGAAQRRPDDPAIAGVLARLDDVSAPSPPATSRRMAPYLQGASLDPRARVAGSGALVALGRLALVPSAWLADGDRVWLRDGLGRTWPATLVRRDPGLDLALLRLDSAAAMSAGPAAAPRDAFPGSPAFAVGYSGGAENLPQWPQMTLGFLGMPVADDSARSLGLDLAPASCGGPVFDAAGRWIGVTVPGANGKARLIAASAARALWETQPDALPARAEAQAAAVPRIGVDELYERALRVAVQVIVVPGDASAPPQPTPGAVLSALDR